MRIALRSPCHAALIEALDDSRSRGWMTDAAKDALPSAMCCAKMLCWTGGAGQQCLAVDQYLGIARLVRQEGFVLRRSSFGGAICMGFNAIVGIACWMTMAINSAGDTEKWGCNDVANLVATIRESRPQTERGALQKAGRRREGGRIHSSALGFLSLSPGNKSYYCSTR